MERNLKKDFFIKFEALWDEDLYGKMYKEHTKEEIWNLFKDYITPTYWKSFVKDYKKLSNDMGYWFNDFNDLIDDFIFNLYGWKG